MKITDILCEGVACEMKQQARITELLSSIVQKNGPIKLQVGNEIVEAASMQNIPGYPKADFSIHDSKGQVVAYVSLKCPKFSWGSWKTMPLTPPIKKWLRAVGEVTNNELESGWAYGFRLNDANAIKHIMFGHEFGGNYSANNVNCVIISNVESINITPNGKYYVLEGDQVYANGDMPVGSHKPYLLLRYSSDRSTFDIQYARAQAMPLSDVRTVVWDNEIG